jgi:hypothetical protein
VINNMNLSDEERRVLRRQFWSILEPQVNAPVASAVSLGMLYAMPAEDILARATVLWKEGE